jgi:hypothetical protein
MVLPFTAFWPYRSAGKGVRRLTDHEGQRLQQIVLRGTGSSPATATTRPGALEQPLTRWSLRKLAAYLAKNPNRAIHVSRDRLPANHHKLHAVRQFHGCCSVGNDTPPGVVRTKKSAVNTLAALKPIRAARPDGHRSTSSWTTSPPDYGQAIRACAARNKVELGFNPTNSSWANPIEAHFGPLRTFVIAGSNHPNHSVQARRTHDYLRRRNANTRHPDLLAAQRRERARIRSETGYPPGRPAHRPDHLTNPASLSGHSTRVVSGNALVQVITACRTTADR